MSASLTPPPQIRNRLLAALINKEYRHLLPHLERVELSLGDVVYRAGEEIRHVYFPETAVISLLSTLESGATTEVGLIGREGMVGLSVFLIGASTHDEALVQVPGSALRMKASVLREELRLGSPLQLLLLHYTRSFITLISQSVVCSQHHTVDQRFARWLLMMQDYAESGELRVTHEMIAAMMGVRRAGISESIAALRHEGLVTSGRGLITILGRQGLEAKACECYGIIREEFDHLYASQSHERRSA